MSARQSWTDSIPFIGNRKKSETSDGDIAAAYEQKLEKSDIGDSWFSAGNLAKGAAAGAAGLAAQQFLGGGFGGGGLDIPSLQLPIPTPLSTAAMSPASTNFLNQRNGGSPMAMGGGLMSMDSYQSPLGPNPTLSRTPMASEFGLTTMMPNGNIDYGKIVQGNYLQSGNDFGFGSNSFSGLGNTNMGIGGSTFGGGLGGYGGAGGYANFSAPLIFGSLLFGGGGLN